MTPPPRSPCRELVLPAPDIPSERARGIAEEGVDIPPEYCATAERRLGAELL